MLQVISSSGFLLRTLVSLNPEGPETASVHQKCHHTAVRNLKVMLLSLTEQTSLIPGSKTNTASIVESLHGRLMIALASSQMLLVASTACTHASCYRGLNIAGQTLARIPRCRTVAAILSIGLPRGNPGRVPPSVSSTAVESTSCPTLSSDLISTSFPSMQPMSCRYHTIGISHSKFCALHSSLTR